MAWDIKATEEFKQWFAGLAEAEQISIGRKVDLLEMLGPVFRKARYGFDQRFALSEIGRNCAFRTVAGHIACFSPSIRFIKTIGDIYMAGSKTTDDGRGVRRSWCGRRSD